MMRVGVFSDSHGDIYHLEKLLDSMGHLDMVLFLGDIAQDAEWLKHKLGRIPNKPVLWAVRGNNDLSSKLPYDCTVCVGQKQLFMTHGHLYQVRTGISSLVSKDKKEGAGIALFGHTHEALCTWESGILVINPGAAGHPYGAHRARACILEIENDYLSVKDVVA